MEAKMRETIENWQPRSFSIDNAPRRKEAEKLVLDLLPVF